MKEAFAQYDTSHWTFQRARRSVVAAAIATAASVAACGGGDSPSGPGTTPPPAATAVGTYSITTVNAKPLPVAIYPVLPEYKYEVTVGSLVLAVDGKYSVKTTYRQTITGNIIEEHADSTSGTWVLTGTAVQFTNALDGSKDNAVWDKDQLTLVETNGKVTPLSVKIGPTLIGGLAQTIDAARRSAAVDPVTYVYKK